MKTSCTLRTTGMVAGLLGAAASTVLAGPPRVIYSTIQTSPTSDVPGYPGLKFDDDINGFVAAIGTTCP